MHYQILTFDFSKLVGSTGHEMAFALDGAPLDTVSTVICVPTMQAFSLLGGFFHSGHFQAIHITSCIR